MPRPPKTIPTCHPDRVHQGLGLCNACYQRKRKELNPEKVIADHSRYYQKNKEKCNQQSVDGHLRRTYGLSPESYRELLKKFNHSCGICGSKHPNCGKKSFAVDHDHSTGKIRGILCHKCNLGLGLFNDDIHCLGLAISYLVRYDRETNTSIP